MAFPIKAAFELPLAFTIHFVSQYSLSPTVNSWKKPFKDQFSLLGFWVLKLNFSCLLVLLKGLKVVCGNQH